MVGGSFLFFLIHAAKEIKIIISKIKDSIKTQMYDEFVRESKRSYKKLQQNLPKPGKAYQSSEYKDPRCYFPHQDSQPSQKGEK